MQMCVPLHMDGRASDFQNMICQFQGDFVIFRLILLIWVTTRIGLCFSHSVQCSTVFLLCVKHSCPYLMSQYILISQFKQVRQALLNTSVISSVCILASS